MTDASEDARNDAEAMARLRRADVWTGLVLAVVAILMILEALTYPLEGTYAGVRNAWYVSPALFPLIVAGSLLALSVGLIAVAARERARLRPDGSLVPRRWAVGGEAPFVALLLAGYIVGLVPRVDFPVATALFLFVFMASYVLDARPTARLAMAACLLAPAALALGWALAGSWPAPRSGGQLAADAMVAAVLPVSAVLAFRLAERGERRRLRTAGVTSVLTAVVLGALFKYGLLVPLPREGLGVAAMDAVAGALAALVG